MIQDPITVIVSLVDMPPLAQNDFDHWGDWLGAKLREAGIPANKDGTLESGTLERFDDPKSWGSTVYIWRPDGYVDPTQ